MFDLTVMKYVARVKLSGTVIPNLRVLMFFREGSGENGGSRLYSVDVTGYNEQPVATPGFASDPAWSPKLN